jgi:hypothetical protein
MTQSDADKVGRFSVVQVLLERGPFRDVLAQDDDGVNWIVTTWPHRSTVVPAPVVEPALDGLAALGAATPDAETEVLVDGYGDVIGLARPRAVGWSVAAWVAQEGKLGAGDAIWLATTLLETLAALRESSPGLLHGGISPNDVFVTDEPRAVTLTGFAAARRAVSQALAPPHEGDPPWVECVDPDFAPPEMRIGNHTGPATDLYGVAGVVLFALTGEGPRAFSGRMNELEDVLVTGYRAPRMLARFLAGALSPTVEVRFQTVEAALDVITGRAADRARAAAEAAAAKPEVPAGQQFRPEPGRAGGLTTKAAALGALLSVPYIVLGVSALLRFGPFSDDLPLWNGLVVAALSVLGTVANIAVLFRRARAEGSVTVTLDEFVLRLSGPELRAESKWSSLRGAQLGSGGVEVIGAWSNGSGGWLPEDLVVLPDVYAVAPARLLATIRETHDRRCPQGWLELPDRPRRAGRPWWLAVPALLVLLGWVGGTGSRIVVGGPIQAAPAATPERVISVEALREEPWRAFELAERDPEQARQARDELERAVESLAAAEAAGRAEGEGALIDGAGACPADMSEFPLIDGGSLPPACLDGSGVMVQAARMTGDGPEWFLVDWTETPARAYIACAAGGNCPAPATDEGCRTELGAKSDWPANCMTTAGAESYCATAGRRLCTADEWYAAAGAIQPADRETFPTGEPTCRTAVIRDARGPGCGLEDAGATAARPLGASRFGAIDMVGNVAELVAGGGGAALGGSWRSAPGSSGGLRSLAFTPSRAVSDVGFRCCRDLPRPPAPGDGG